MARVNKDICPSCGKERELAYFKMGLIQSTMCPYCLQKYLEFCVIPRLQNSSDTTTDKCQITVNGAVVGGFLNGTE